MNNSSQSMPESIQPVCVRRHPVDWEANDLAEVTAQRALSLGTNLERGCWYLNPQFTVSSPAPTAEFFRKVLDLRSSWLRTCRQVLGNHGQRRLARQAESQGRLGAILTINPEAEEESPDFRPPRSVPLSGLPDDQQREVIEAGQIARQLSLSGILFIDGNPIPPRTWIARADELLNPAGDATPIRVYRRRVDLDALESSGDPNPLKAVTLAELRVHLAANPDAALYVTPGVTVAAPTPGQAFLAEARKRSDEWHGKLYRTLGSGKKPLFRAADLPTLMLVYCGTLVIKGQCYIPGCWPNENATKARLKRTPFQAPTVPPSYLGLDLSPQAAKDHQYENIAADCPGTSPTNPGGLNGLFVRFFATGRPWLS